MLSVLLSNKCPSPLPSTRFRITVKKIKLLEFELIKCEAKIGEFDHTTQ